MTITTDMTVNLSPIIDEVLLEIRTLEQDVIAKTAALQTAREQLAHARGQLEMIGILQRMAQTSAHNGVEVVDGNT